MNQSLNHPVRCPLLAVGVVAVVGLLASPIRAQTDSDLDVNCAGQLGSLDNVPGPAGPLSCNNTFMVGPHTVTATTTVQTLVLPAGPGLLRPTSVAVADASYQATVAGGSGVGGSATGFADIFYEAAIVEIAAPPFAPPTVHFTVDARGGGMLSSAGAGNPNGTYSSIVNLLYPAEMGGGGQNFTASSGGPVPSFNQTLSLSAPIAALNANIDVFMRAVASAGISGAPASGTGSSHAEAFADPLFEFDQAAFDLEHGANSFPQANFYEFQFSEGIVAVPSPSSVWLALPALTVLIGSRMTRRASGA